LLLDWHALGLPRGVVDLWVNKSEVGIPLHHCHWRSKEGVALNDGLNDLRVLVTVHDLIVVLGLHASANAAVNAVRDRVNQSRCVPQAWLKDGGNVADASQTLEGDHGAEEAVVALGVLNCISSWRRYLVARTEFGKQQQVSKQRQNSGHFSSFILPLQGKRPWQHV